MHHSHNYRHEIILRMCPSSVANHLRQVERILLTVDILIHVAEHHCRRSVLQPVEAGVHLGLLVVVLHLHAILQSRPGVVDHLYIALTDQVIECLGDSWTLYPRNRDDYAIICDESRNGIGNERRRNERSRRWSRSSYMCEEGITIEYLWVQQEVSLISAKEGQWLGQMVSIHL